MREWLSPYNSFNSYKGLLYREQFKAIMSGKFLPPVEVNIDPVNNCNLDCIWCNSKRIISRDKKVIMSTSHLLDLVNFCADWGVKAICFAGGGEPTMHPNLPDAIELAYSRGLETALITNGLFQNDRQIDICAKYLRWIGVSVDAGTKDTYIKVKKRDCYYDVVANMRKLIKAGAKEVTYKYLIHPCNQHEILEACFTAKEIGCHQFHSRIISDKYLENHQIYDMERVNDLIVKCHEFCGNEKFKVFTISHKQEGDGNRRMRFDKCKASPLLCMMEADGTVSVCIDRKGDQRVVLCHHDNPKDVATVWGGEYHRKLLSEICPQSECPKCTMTVYQELYEAYAKDSFYVNFP